jgi:3-phosphoshikimate 1-carboxyvinyltransferase
MKAYISKSNISGKAAAPPSKSYTIRALMCAGLAPGQSLVRNPLKADDTAAATSALSRLGVAITEDKSDWRVYGGRLKALRGTILPRVGGHAALYDGHCGAIARPGEADLRPRPG